MSGIGIVVLAAGRSTRFVAGPHPSCWRCVGDTPLVRLAVNGAIDAHVGDVVVVTGDRSDDVALSLEGLPAPNRSRTSIRPTAWRRPSAAAFSS